MDSNSIKIILQDIKQQPAGSANYMQVFMFGSISIFNELLETEMRIFVQRWIMNIITAFSMKRFNICKRGNGARPYDYIYRNWSL
jgi:hypothetical protein